MTVNNEETMTLNLNNDIRIIKRIGPYDNVSLHIASHYKSNEFIQLILTNNVLKSFENLSNELLFYDEIKKLHIKKADFCDSNEELQESDYIEWSLVGNNLIEKRKEFCEQIDLYKTYDNQHHLITKLLIEIIDYYLNEYLIQQEHFSKEQTNKLEFYFKKAIEEQNYLEYFIKAYTLTNNFYHVLNKHLALYILDYFDTLSYSSSPTKYRLINCLVHIVTLVINHPDIHKYKYRGIAYRGLLMTENDLKNYSIGNHILNRSFVSTSKNRSVAQIFADNSQETSGKISVLLKYTIKQNRTAIDIEHISTIQDEKEALILPFAVFQIKDRIENNPNTSPPVLVEIDLEECEDDQETNSKEHKSKYHHIAIYYIK